MVVVGMFLNHDDGCESSSSLIEVRKPPLVCLFSVVVQLISNCRFSKFSEIQLVTIGYLLMWIGYTIGLPSEDTEHLFFPFCPSSVPIFNKFLHSSSLSDSFPFLLLKTLFPSCNIFENFPPLYSQNWQRCMTHPPPT